MDCFRLLVFLLTFAWGGLVLAQKPKLSWGVASGDVDASSAVVWSRSDRPAKMIVEYGSDPEWAEVRRAEGPDALKDTDFTAKVLLSGLPSGKTIHYRVMFQSLEDLRMMSDPAEGSFQTAPSESQPIRLAWSGDTAGQGWGINPEDGGMKIYEAIRKFRPNFFIHSGDTIYADGPILPEVKLDDGSVWRNVTTLAKSKVAETLEEFHGNYRYNLLDANVRRFNAEVPVFVQWDDHETTNNWYPNEQLVKDSRYKVKSVALLSARAKKAFFDYNPIRSEKGERKVYRSFSYGPDLEVFLVDLRTFRGNNSANQQEVESDETQLLGKAQYQWLVSGLSASKATWKIVACDMPLGLMIRDGKAFEGVANGDGQPRGRELEVARLLSDLKKAKVHNIVWVTADVHYAAAHRYTPEKAQFKDFDPFWEFVSGPMHAGTFGPTRLDNTFGPTLEFLSIPKGMKGNRPPSAGFQFFGGMVLDPKTRGLTVTQHNRAGKELYSVTLEPKN